MADTLRANGKDGGRADMQPLVAGTLGTRIRHAHGDGDGETVIAAPLTKGSATGEGVNAPGRRQEDDVNIVAFHPTGGGAKGLSDTDDLAPGTGTGTGGTVAVALTASYGTKWNGNAGAFSGGNFAPPTETGVRRLTPTECERLQGLPDGWTLIEGASDSKRYSALGDAVTASVAEWIGDRLAVVAETSRTEEQP